jgi:phosphomethylpyrimidine synthase
MIQQHQHEQGDDRFARPLLGAHNPSSSDQGTTPGSFARPADVGGPYMFASPDTPGMPEPSPCTAWDFMPAGSNRPEPVTQLEHARLGVITPQMRRVAERETHLTPEQVRDEVAAGRMIIPANRVHLGYRLDPMCIGRASRTKVNANMGASPVTSDTAEELEKLRFAERWGADTVMDLSTGGNLDACREAIIRNSTVPIGTVPIYSMIIGRRLEDLTHEVILSEIEHQAAQGVDYFRSGCSCTMRRTPCTSCGTRSARSCVATTSASRSATACGRADWGTPPTTRSSPSWRRSAS